MKKKKEFDNKSFYTTHEQTYFEPMASPESPQYQILNSTMKLDIPLEDAEIDENYKSPAMAPDSPAMEFDDTPVEIEEYNYPEEFKGNFSPITPMDLNARPETPEPEPEVQDLDNIYTVPDYLKQPYTEEELKSFEHIKKETGGGILDVKEVTEETKANEEQSNSTTKTFNIN